MLKVIKYVLYFCLTVFFIFTVIPLAMVFFISPEFYKNSLVTAIQKTTGRQTVIQGRLSWTFYPSLGVSASQVEIEAPADFAGGGSFMSIGSLTAGMDIEKLSAGKIQINKLTLDGVKLNLVKNAIGQSNWQFKKNNINNTVKSTQNSPSSSSNKHLFQFQVSDISLSQLAIHNAEVHYQDQQHKKEFEISRLNLKLDQAAINQAFPISADFVLSTPKISEPVNVNFSANMTVTQTPGEPFVRLDNLIAKTNQYQWQGTLKDNLNKNDIAAISGQLAVSGTHGAFKGIDLYYYSDLADALIHKTKPTQQDTHQTPFNQLQASLEINNGIVDNRNLIIEANQMEAKGNGQINLITQQLDYHLSLQRMTQGKEVKPRGPAIPLNITGDISSPDIRPNWQGFLVDQLQEQLQTHGEEIGQKINSAIQQGLQALVGN